MTTVPSPTTQPDLSQYLPDADRIVDGLPWIVGRTPSQHRATRGRAAALVSQIAQMLESGWTTPEIAAVLDGANMDGIGNAEGQEARWRKALKAARAARRRAAELAPASDVDPT
ncbi:MAG: hypothetical protein AUG49_22395 [Catenulispora sp. 13_1_20CM_3_70_7]|nr:MAG: hypothetical protein AUG49_22395 [Catenulispora sp. 13_1_20CM_3_70_7]